MTVRSSVTLGLLVRLIKHAGMVHVTMIPDIQSFCSFLAELSPAINLNYTCSTVHYQIDEKSGCVAVPVNLFCLYFIIFAIFKNFVHSLEPGETPSYSASHQVLNYAQRS